MSALTRVLQSRRFFICWFGLGAPPFFAGAVGIAFGVGVGFGLVTLAVMLAWIYESTQTACTRCPFYKTARCGLPGLAVPLFFARKTSPISRGRIRAHYLFDLAMIASLTALYALRPVYLPLALLWSAVAWKIAFGPKRFHGLSFRLRTSAGGSHRGDGLVRISNEGGGSPAPQPS